MLTDERVLDNASETELTIVKCLLYLFLFDNVAYNYNQSNPVSYMSLVLPKYGNL